MGVPRTPDPDPIQFMKDYRARFLSLQTTTEQIPANRTEWLIDQEPPAHGVLHEATTASHTCAPDRRDLIRLVAPRLGAAAYVSAMIVGTMAASILVDHVGLVGFREHPIGALRLVGGALVVGGMVLVQTN